MLALLLAALIQDDEDTFLGIREGQLAVSNESGSVQFSLRGIIDLEAYETDEVAPGLLFRDESFFNPRVTLFTDLFVGDHFFFSMQVRADRGFDPFSEETFEIRADELFARYTLEEEDWSLSLQLGKFATPLGNFVPRHDSMHHPFVRAPLVYDYVTTVGDNKAPANNKAFLGRRDIADLKGDWVAMIWGPVYHAGFMAFGTLGRFDLRLAVANAAPCERPDEWTRDLGDPDLFAFSARLGWNPFIGFRVGINYAYGPYYREIAEDTLRRDREDYPQKLVGIDLEYAIGHFQFFAELYASEWHAPNLDGGLRALAYYVEARYKIRPGLYAALRWNQIVFDEIPDASGRDRHWDRDTIRIQAAVGYYLYVNLLAKLEYEIDQNRGKELQDNVLSASLSFSF